MNELSTALTPEEMAAFDGLEESYRLMTAERDALAPRCHFRPMFMDEVDGMDGHGAAWWECSVCGHTKPVQ